jgi:hypothetical protein
MDILITDTNEVVAQCESITRIEQGWLVGESVYPGYLTRETGVTIPEELRGKRLAYVDGEFSELPPVQTPATKDDRDAKKAALAAKRYEVEIGGIEIAGAKVKTDRESQASLTGAYTSLKEGMLTSIDWKTEDGWVTLDLESCEAIAQAVAVHVQACFTQEKELSALIDAAQTVEDLAEINLDNWA